MNKDKVDNFVESIVKMEFVDLVRLCLRMSDSNYINLNCDKKNVINFLMDY